MKKSSIFSSLSFVLLLLLSCSSNIFAQNLVNCTVITHEGDTLLGKINYNDNETTPKQFFLYQEKNTIKINPSNVKRFFSTDFSYVSAIVDLQIEEKNLNRMSKIPNLETKKDTVFLEVLFEGKKSLYRIKNSQKDLNFYIKSEADTFALLQYKKYVKVFADQSEKLAENNTYKNQLDLYFLDCPSIAAMIVKSSYQTTDLIRIFAAYYQNCASKEKWTAINLQKFKSEKALGVTATVSLVALTGNLSEFYMSENNFDLGFGGGISGTFEMISRRNRKSLSFYNEIGIYMYNIQSGEVPYKGLTSYKKTSRFSLQMTYFHFAHLLRHTFGNIKDKWRPYFTAGASYGLMLNHENHLTESIDYPVSGIKTFPADNKVAPRSFTIGLATGLGLRSNKTNFELRYHIGDGFSSYMNLKTATHSVSFCFGYILWKK